MHYSAKRGLAIACRPSVCPSVCNVGVSGSHRLEIFETIVARTLSPTPSLFVTQRPPTYSKGNMGKFWETRGGVGKSGVLCWSTKAAISPKSVKIEEKLLWRAYRNLLTLFWMVPFRPPRAFSFQRLGVHNPQPKLQSLLSQEQVELRTSNMVRTFTGSIATKAY